MKQRQNLNEINKGTVVLPGVILFTGLAGADEATEEEYKEQAENHRKMASWCKRNLPAKDQLRLEQDNRFVFQEPVNDGRSEPSISDLKKLAEDLIKIKTDLNEARRVLNHLQVNEKSHPHPDHAWSSQG